MMSLLTGLPGAGKTAYLVEQKLMPLAAKNWEESAIDSQGNKVVVKRRLFTNVNGLLLDHEKIGQDEINSWPQWVKPGDIIVYDEIQEPWPKVPAGSKKPECIQQLEKHRHYGVDFWLLTQHPNLVNDAIITLASQHLHIRKLGASRFATVYEWDGVSRSLMYKNAFAKKPWRRGKAVEQMYRSSALHTKQKRAIPTVLFAVMLALVIFPVGAYFWGGKFKERYFGGPKSLQVAPGGPGAAPVPLGAVSSPVNGVPPPLPAASGTRPVVFTGCAATKTRCTCYDSADQQVIKELSWCQVQTLQDRGPPANLARLRIPDQELHEAQIAAGQRDGAAELVAFARSRGEAQSRARAPLKVPPH